MGTIFKSDYLTDVYSPVTNCLTTDIKLGRRVKTAADETGNEPADKPFEDSEDTILECRECQTGYTVNKLG